MGLRSLDLKRKGHACMARARLRRRCVARNGLTPEKIEVNPETFAVKVDGVHATVKPAKSISLNQLYFFS